MDLQDELKPYRERYEDLDVRESGHWPAVLAGHLARFKRPNLAIVAIVAVIVVDAYKSPPTPMVLAAIGAITLLGLVGGRDG